MKKQLLATIAVLALALGVASSAFADQFTISGTNGQVIGMAPSGTWYGSMVSATGNLPITPTLTFSPNFTGTYTIDISAKTGSDAITQDGMADNGGTNNVKIALAVAGATTVQVAAELATPDTVTSKNVVVYPVVLTSTDFTFADVVSGHSVGTNANLLGGGSTLTIPFGDPTGTAVGFTGKLAGQYSTQLTVTATKS